MRQIVSFLALLLFASTVAAAPGYAWVNVTMNAPFTPRDGAGALVFQEQLWLIGGWNSRDTSKFPRACVNDVWRSQDGADWTLVKPNTFLDNTFDGNLDWEGRHTAGYAVHDGKMWILGGDAIQGHDQSDVWNSADGKTWTRVIETAPWAPRVLHMSAVFDGKIWIMGGQTLPPFVPSEERFYRDIWTTTDGVHWEEVKPKEPCWSPRGMIGGSAVLNGRLWILGGGTYDTPNYKERNFYNDVWSTTDGVHWAQHTPAAPWRARQYHDVAAFDGRLWVLEGYDGEGGDARTGNRNDVWYSADGEHWEELPGTPWAKRHAASVFVFDNALWIVAGNNMESDVWKLVRRE